LLDDFSRSFVDADLTIVPEIYYVRDSEEERARIRSADLVDRINRNGQQALHVPGFDGILAHLKRDTREGDVVVTMGAGTVWEIGRDLVAAGQ
jgi:UDP-N-acetylmuramate--alanine ligase